MAFLRNFLQILALAMFASLGLAEQFIDSEITGYEFLSKYQSGFASSSNTLYTGAQGSEHSASFNDPGDCATNIDEYPINTLIYVVTSSPQLLQPISPPLTQQQGLQKYFSVQDSCGNCSTQSQPHFDVWMGVPSYSNSAQLTQCADGITVVDPTATVIIDPDDGYFVDTTPLMSGTGVCDTDADYSRTQPVLATGGTTEREDSEGPTTFSTVVSSATPSASAQSGGNGCTWTGHCQGDPCRDYNDCFNPYSCVNNVCT
ncbi:hypothetical protein IMSHALPRED_000685 [Imshaugia aleurites]|uniref:Uncharacterized protein n=1 Tax=Imshaugia aleurites TaxID=172621 RepID=A0A8H3IS06_9LECA|nr:hypothetical protein IMSHALPRED_000685 [Imshaugia aleurites]